MKTKCTLAAPAGPIKKNIGRRIEIRLILFFAILICYAINSKAQDRNTNYGDFALDKNTTGSYNSAFGWGSLYNNLNGNSNTGCGYHSLYTNQSGLYNTAIGAGSLNYNMASYNTALGCYSLYSNTSGVANTANGFQSLRSNGTGNNNTANGYQSLSSNTGGSSNTASGSLSLYTNNNGNYNTASGYASLYLNNSGSYNTAIGQNSLYNNNSGHYNTAIGFAALINNSTGSSNTGIGYNANVSSGNLTNATAIGFNAIATASNQIMLGNTNVTSVRLTSSSSAKYLEFFKQGTSSTQADWRFEHDGNLFYVSSSDNDFTGFCDDVSFGKCNDNFKFAVYGNAMATTWQTSDLKLKKNITEFNRALDIIKQLKPKTYFFKTDEYHKLNLSAFKQYGFIAQDLEQVLPELVQTSKQAVRVNAAGERQMEDLKAVNYTELIPILTRAIQEQQQQIEELKEMVKKLSSQQSAATTTIAESAKANVVITDASLEQNIPNPLTNTTSIRYNIPAGSKKAQLTISDNSGKAIKQITLNGGTGVVNIDASMLRSGTYNYTLLIDGKLIESKKMVIAR